MDARNGFNELLRKAMLWTVRHLWPAGARFAAVCYRHQTTLVLRRPGGDAEYLQSREGVAQGDPFAMLLYGLALVPLSKRARVRVAQLLHLWYADDGALCGPLRDIAAAARIIAGEGPHRGYYMEVSKSLLLVPSDTTAEDLAALDGLAFKRVECARYLGGYLGTEQQVRDWVRPQAEAWAWGVRRLAMVARRFPQAALHGLTRSLQQEWQYLQRVLPGVDDEYGPVEAAIADDFLPALFGMPKEEVAPFRRLLGLPTKFGGIGVPAPTLTGPARHETSVDVTTVLVDALRPGGDEFNVELYVAEGKEAKKLHRNLRDADCSAEMAAVSSGSFDFIRDVREFWIIE